ASLPRSALIKRIRFLTRDPFNCIDRLHHGFRTSGRPVVHINLRDIRTAQKLDMAEGGVPITPIVLKQPTPHVTGRDPYDCVLTRIIGRHPLEQSDADRTLFQAIDFAFQSLFYDVAEELLAAMTSTKCGPLDDLVQVVANRLNFLFAKRETDAARSHGS